MPGESFGPLFIVHPPAFIVLEAPMIEIANLQGCGTALATPFHEDRSIDEDALRRLVEFQIADGIDFLVPCGTTGESVTLSAQELCRVVEIVLHEARRPPCSRARSG